MGLDFVSSGSSNRWGRVGVRSLVFWSVLTLGFGGFTQAAESESHMKKSSSGQEVQTWERLGLRWALGRGKQGEALVLSDLSFPWLLDRTLLLKVGGKDGVQGSLSAVQEGASLLRPISKPLARAEEQILGAKGDLRWLEEGSLVPWLASARTDVPRSLADVDWSQWRVGQQHLKQTRRFDEAWGKLASIFFGREALQAIEAELHRQNPGSLAGGSRFSGEFLRSALYLERSAEEGALEITFDPARALRERWQLRGEIPSPAKRVVDFQCPSCGFWEMIGFDALDNAIDVAISFIPVPGLQQVLGTAFDRLFHYREEAYRLQWAMLWEAIDAAALRPQSPEGQVLASLTCAEREHAISILQYSDSTLSTVIRWLWQRPLKAWKSSLERDQRRSDLAAHWLRERGLGLQDVTPNFTLGRSLLGEQWLYSLAAYRVFPSITEPAVVVDYQKPDYLKVRRIAIDSATAAVGFASRFAPWVGNAVRIAWTAAVEQPQRVLQHREARLAWVLETRDPGLTHSAQDLRVIEGQRMNPFVFRQQKMREQVEKRWKALGVALPKDSGQGLAQE